MINIAVMVELSHFYNTSIDSGKSLALLMIHDEEAQNIKITIQSCLQNHVSIPNKLNYVHET